MIQAIKEKIKDLSLALFSIDIDDNAFPAKMEGGLYPLDSLNQNNADETKNKGKGIHLWLPDVDTDSYVLFYKTEGSSINLAEQVTDNKIEFTKVLLSPVSTAKNIWICYASQDGLTPSAAELNKAGFPKDSITLNQGLTAFYPITKETLHDVFRLPVEIFPFEDLLLSAHFGEDFMNFTASVTPKNLDWLGDKVQFQAMEVGYITPYGEVALADFQVYLNAQISLFSKESSASFFATVDYKNAAVKGIQLEIEAGVDLKEGINSLATLFTDQTSWSIPEQIPTANVHLHNLTGDISLNGDHKGLTALSGSIKATFNSWSPLGDRFNEIGDIFALKEVGMDFSWQQGFAVSWKISGDIEVASYDLQVGFLYPHQVITAGLAPTNTSTGDISKFLTDKLNVPESASNIVSKVLTAVDLSVYGDLKNNEVQFIVRNSKAWHLFGDTLQVSNMDLRISLAQINGKFGFADAELFVVLELPIGHKQDDGIRAEVQINIDALYDNAENFWSFAGETGTGQGIAVGDAIGALVNKLGGDGPKSPEAIKNLEVQNISLNFDSNGNADFVCETTLDFEGQEVEFWVHLKRDDQGLTLSGSIFLNGFQLAVAFASESNSSKGAVNAQGESSDKYVVGNLTLPITLHTQEILAALNPRLAEDVPIDVAVQLKGMLIGIHFPGGNAADSEKGYLFRLLFDIEFDLHGFPLIGEMLKSVKFANTQVLAAKNDWAPQAIESINSLLSEIKPEQPPSIESPIQSEGNTGISTGISLSGTFEIAEELQVPLFLNFEGNEQQGSSQGDNGSKDSHDKGQSSDGSQPARAAQKGQDLAPTSQPDQRSQSKLDKMIGAIRIKKVALIFEDKRLGLKLTGGLALAGFEFELMGMQVTVPQSVLNDPSDVTKVKFGLDGFAAKIQKGTLSIMGAFLHQHYEKSNDIAAYDEYNGIIQVRFKPFNLAGMGSYAEFNGHTSLFLFVALGFPIPVHPSLLIEGFALGFGIHRDFISPKLNEILSYPLIEVSVTPPPPIDIGEMATKMHDYFPPTEGLYFVVAGIKFKAFSILDSIVMVAVKFDHSVEIDLIGISSIYYPSTLIELAWEAQFIPDKGYLLIGGELTSRSHLFIQEVQLTGGFAVAAWLLSEHQGDFVATMGGYHPLYKFPQHYPNHISRLGISFHLDPITVKGGVYFAVTPQCLMMGGVLEASLEKDFIKASLKMAIDAIIYFEPFHYDLTIGVDAGVGAEIGKWGITYTLHLHLHLDVHLWGPEFSGIAAIDVGPKTFELEFGEGSSVKALPVSWDGFKKKFLQTKNASGEPNDHFGNMIVTEGLLRTVKVDGTETHIVDSRTLVIEIKSLIPLTDTGNHKKLGIVPMDVRGGAYKAQLHLKGDIGSFAKSTPILATVPTGIWGEDGLRKPDISGSADGLVKGVCTGKRITPQKGEKTAETHSVPKGSFAYNTDQFILEDQSAKFAINVEDEKISSFDVPTETFEFFTGLNDMDLTAVDASQLLQTELYAFELA